LRLNVWSPLPPSPSGIADYVAETLPSLGRRFEVTAVVPDPAGVGEPPSGTAIRSPVTALPADLDLYEIGNSPAHAYVYRAALARPGVVALHEWSLHHLVLHETVERGDRAAYHREMRRAHGEAGTFVARQVARGLGGDLLPALFPLNDRLLEGSLGVVALTRYVADRVARRDPGRPVLRLNHHLAEPDRPLPSRAEARELLGLPLRAPLIIAPGLATAAKGLDAGVRVVARLRGLFPGLRLVIAGDVDPRLPLREWARGAQLGDGLVVTGRLALADFVRHLVAADVVLALRFPTHGEISGALVRALGVGRPALVSAGTPAAEEFPEGVVIPIDPGPRQEDELFAVLARLLTDEGLREVLGRLARDHVRRHNDLETEVARLADFLLKVEAAKGPALAAIQGERADEGSLLGFLLEEARWSARDLGLAGAGLGLKGRLRELVAKVQ
jgi:glycosyltransferase involved in cell wall biosynthesis